MLLHDLVPEWLEFPSSLDSEGLVIGGGADCWEGAQRSTHQRGNHVLLKDPDNNIKTTIFDITKTTSASFRSDQTNQLHQQKYDGYLWRFKNKPNFSGKDVVSKKK